MGNHAKAWCEAFKFFGIDFPAEMAHLNEGRIKAASTINLIFQRDSIRAATKEEISMIYTKKQKYLSNYYPVRKWMELMIY